MSDIGRLGKNTNAFMRNINTQYPTLEEQIYLWRHMTGQVQMSAPQSGEASDSDTSTGPEIEKRAREVIDDLLQGRVVRGTRQDMRRALDKTDVPESGRVLSDKALGRAVRGF